MKAPRFASTWIASTNSSPAADTQLKAEELQVRKVLSSDYDFRIPNYQRPYAWPEDKAVQLLEDLEQSLELDTPDAYFLGSLVLVKPPGSQTVDVIDGQQRLTTLTILLAILRDLSSDSQFTLGLEKFIIEPGDVLAGIPSKARLQLRARDNTFFSKYVQTSGMIPILVELDDLQLATDAQRRIRQNAAALYRELTTWHEIDRQALARLISTHTYLVIVTTADITSAYRIFSVMNARGLNLTPPDIFKSQVIGSLKSSKQSEYSEKWEDAEDELNRSNFLDLFQHVRMIFAKERPRRELLREFPEQVLDAYLPQDPDEFVDHVLIPYADAYARILKQDFVATTGAEKVNSWLKRLIQVDNNDWRPPALWALRYHTSTAFLDEFFEKLERLAASMLLRRVYATPRSMRYAELLKQLEEGYGLESPAFDLTRAEKKETRERLDGQIYLVPPVRKYVLLRLDEMLANKPGVTYDHKIISVEHVLPQNPSTASGWLEAFDEEDRNNWTHRLANLVLLNRTKNSEAQNFSFREKKSKYFTSKKGVATFSLTVGVLEYKDWTPDILKLRQAQLLETLHAEWSL